ncbi:hypothetical protein TrVE_jg1799 [Triparma verrucosa]|uniref:Ras-domain-containing protein n=2 Tax=Triparma TaxID=722752 RepID=A0A9W6ZU40_9STRA|nr:hypothetical protein TrST_g10886 [Triparma strigata]GMH99595.1 hypothetical protein TrVE_jg1799 [Triparma verrucosa]
MSAELSKLSGKRRSKNDTASSNYVVSPPKSTNSRAKLILLGDAYVGKTSLILRYVHNTFSPHTLATVGSAYISKTLPQKPPLTLDIWDTAGQERFRGMNMGLYYRGSRGGVIVYDVTSRTSFEKAKVWLKELREAVGVPDNVGVDEPGYIRNGIVLALAGNKRDLVTGKSAGGIRGEDLKLDKGAEGVPKREVPEEEARQWSEEEGLLFFETSAKDDKDDGVKNLFEEVVFWINVAMKRKGEEQEKETIELSMPKGGGGCCGGG